MLVPLGGDGLVCGVVAETNMMVLIDDQDPV